MHSKSFVQALLGSECVMEKVFNHHFGTGMILFRAIFLKLVIFLEINSICREEVEVLKKSVLLNKIQKVAGEFF